MNKKFDSIKNLIAKRRARLASSTCKIPVQEAPSDNNAVSVDGVSGGIPTEQAVDEAPVEQLVQDETPTEVGEVPPAAETAEITPTEGVASEESVETSPAVEATSEEPAVEEQPSVEQAPVIEGKRRRRRRNVEESDV